MSVSRSGGSSVGKEYYWYDDTSTGSTSSSSVNAFSNYTCPNYMYVTGKRIRISVTAELAFTAFNTADAQMFLVFDTAGATIPYSYRAIFNPDTYTTATGVSTTLLSFYRKDTGLSMTTGSSLGSSTSTSVAGWTGTPIFASTITYSNGNGTVGTSNGVYFFKFRLEAIINMDQARTIGFKPGYGVARANGQTSVSAQAYSWDIKARVEE